MDDQEIVPGFSVDDVANSDTHYSPALEGENEKDLTISEEPSKETQQNQRHKKKKAPAQHKIDRLIYEMGVMEQEKSFLQMQNVERENLAAYQAQKIQELENQLQAKEQNEGSNFITALDSEQRRIKGELRRAKEDGDVDREIELVDQLAEVKARKNAYDVYKANQAQTQEYLRTQEEYRPIETTIPNVVAPPPPPIDPEYQEWLEDNSWYVNNPQLRQEADAIAQDLSNRLSFNNQSHLIGTPEFRDSVTKLMNDRYGVSNSEQNYDEQESSDYVEPRPANNYAPSRSQYNVSPVTRRGSSMADDYQKNNAQQYGKYVPLTKEEYAMARHLPNKGGTMREADLIREYQKGKSYPKSPLPGGTPWRLTII